MRSLRETLAALRYRHFIREVIEHDLDLNDNSEPVVLIGRALKNEKQRLRDRRLQADIN